MHSKLGWSKTVQEDEIQGPCLCGLYWNKARYCLSFDCSSKLFGRSIYPFWKSYTQIEIVPSSSDESVVYVISEEHFVREILVIPIINLREVNQCLTLGAADETYNTGVIFHLEHKWQNWTMWRNSVRKDGFLVK
jgi:hypothetical protein